MIYVPRFLVLGISFSLFAGTASADPLLEALDAHLSAHADGKAAFSFDASVYSDEISHLPIGVFDSGIGGLTVLEAILRLDAFDNDNLRPGPDGRPDFEDERFLYLGDQANMPYGNYSKVGKGDYLRELILKDAVFLLGNRYRSGAGDPAKSGEELLRHDKPPVKAIVIACNTATAYGFEDLRESLARWKIPVIVVGVVEAGAKGLLEMPEGGAIGIMATVGTCASEVYPRTIQSILGRAGRGVAQITQFGSPNLAAIIEGDPAHTTPVAEEVREDVRQLVEAHRERGGETPPQPLSKIMLGCTHFPLALEEIDDAFSELRKDPDYAPFIAENRDYIDPAEWTARELFRELASARLRRRPETEPATGHDLFFISVPHPESPAAILTGDGGLDYETKYGRETGRFEVEDTVVIPMTRGVLPASSRSLVRNELPEVWRRLPAGSESEDLGAAPVVTAKSWAIAEAKTGKLLWGRGQGDPRKAASTTKMMCALTVMKLVEKDPGIMEERVTFSRLADSTSGSTAGIEAGESLSMRDCLFGLLLPSGNDAGNALAEHFHERLDPPDEAMLERGLSSPALQTRVHFIAEMNRNARALGLNETFYRISYGDGGTNEDTTTTAIDLCLLASECLKVPLLAECFATERYVGKAMKPDGSFRDAIWENTNPLLSLDLGYDGVKTGTAPNAGACLVASGRRDGDHLIVVVLGSASRLSREAETRNLFRWAWLQRGERG